MSLPDAASWCSPRGLRHLLSLAERRQPPSRAPGTSQHCPPTSVPRDVACCCFSVVRRWSGRPACPVCARGLRFPLSLWLSQCSCLRVPPSSFLRHLSPSRQHDGISPLLRKTSWFPSFLVCFAALSSSLQCLTSGTPASKVLELFSHSLGG